jgi:hypothetical protein
MIKRVRDFLGELNRNWRLRMIRKFLIISFITVLSLTIVVKTISVAGQRNIETVKTEAPAFLEGQGFEIIVSEGWTRSLIAGGKVWYIVSLDGVSYNLFITIRNTGELMLWELDPIAPMSDMNIQLSTN